MKRILALLVCVCLILQGCASLQGVPVPRGEQQRPDIKVGEKVEVTTRQGTTGSPCAGGSPVTCGRASLTLPGGLPTIAALAAPASFFAVTVVR